MLRVAFGMLSITMALAGVAQVASARELPTHFIANEGQWNAPFGFKAQVENATYYITSAGMTIDLREYESQPLQAHDPFNRFVDHSEPEPVSVRGHVLKLNFVNSNSSPEIVGEDKLSHYSNYFLGRDSCQWRSRVSHYQRVVMKNVWPGIDVELVAQKEGVETVYHVIPHADPSQIEIEVEGLDVPLSVDAKDNLRLHTSLGILTEKAPFAFQNKAGVQKSVPVRYRLLSGSRYALIVAEHNPQQELVIDPLLYGSYLGGYGPDWIYDLAIDANGEVVVCGPTQSNGFPTTPGAYQEEFAAPGGMAGGFVSRFSADGDSLRFSTYLAVLSDNSVLQAIALDTSGRPYVGGYTEATNWPVTPDAVQPVYGGGNQDGIFCRLSADGTALEYSSYLGAGGPDAVHGLAVGSDSLVYMCGQAPFFPGFPVTPNALFPNFGGGGDGFLTVFDPSVSALFYSTYIPGTRTETAYKILPVGEGRVWVSGQTNSTDFPVTPNAFQAMLQSVEDGTLTAPDAFFMLWDLNQNQLLYSSYLGWSGRETACRVLPRDADRVYVYGATRSPDFPFTPGAFDTTVHPDARYNGFVAALSVTEGLEHATLLSGGADGDDYVYKATADSTGITVVGRTSSFDFPVTPDADDTLLNADGSPGTWIEDVFVLRLSSDLSTLRYGTFLGGSHVEYPWAAAFVSSDTVWIGGETGSTDFPLTPNAFQSEGGPLGDGFLAKFVIPAPDTLRLSRPQMPREFALSVYPNPFNPSATITFSLHSTERVRLHVYDLLGREIRVYDWGVLEAGSHRRTIDAFSLASGNYWAHLQVGSAMYATRLVLLR